MANTLEFALGLQTGNFIKNVLAASGVIEGLRLIATGVESVFRKVDESIERAAGLEELSKRTGETVGTLYRLQEAFKTVGLSADTVPTMTLRIQRALSGVNEMGRSTSMAFARLGLDINSLKGADAATQITVIAGALARLPKEQATGLASQLFGRFGMGDILQIARSSGTFSGTLADAARDAAVYERVARGAERIHEAWTAAAREINAAWTYIAEGILPALRRIAERVKAVPWTEWGKEIGGFLYSLEKAFESGDLARMLTLAIEIGFGEAEPYVVAFAKGMGASILEVMKVVATTVGELLGSQLVNQVVDNARLIPARIAVATANKNILNLSGQATEAEKSGDYERAKKIREYIRMEMDNRAAALAKIDEIEQEHITTGNQIIADAMGKLKSTDILGAFMRNFAPDTTDTPELRRKKLEMRRLLELGQLDYNAAIAAGAVGGRGATGGPTDLSSSHYRPVFTELEKMGFVMGGAGTALGYQRRMADGIDRLVTLASAPQPSVDSSPLVDV